MLPRLLFVILLLLPVPAAHADLVPEGVCLTPAAADGFEPPCNPALADSEWPTSHRASHESGSSPYPAPRPGVEIEHTHVALPGLVAATFPTFSARDRNGLQVMWANVNAPFSVVKTDLRGWIIDTWDELSDEGRQPTVPTDQTATNVYNAVDRDGNYLLASGTGIAVWGNSVPGDNASPIKLLNRYQLPAFAQCRAPDPIVGLSVLPDGMVALATKNGVVAVVPRRPGRQKDAEVRAVRLDPRCDDPSVPEDELEENSNSIASDVDGGIYVVTNRAQYRVDWNGKRLRKRWATEYKRGRTAGAYTSSTRTAGSGQSPDVVSAGPGTEKFIVIGDGQPLMHLLYIRAKDGSIACEVPVDFGRPGLQKSSSEQSILTRGYASIVTDNTVPNEEVIRQLPAAGSAAVNLFLGAEGTVAKGVERIDWDPKARRCVTRWANPEASVPNAVPSMSSATGLVYGIANRSGVWGLQGLDFETGEPSLWAPAGPQMTENSFFAMTTVGPEDTIWTGTPFGLSIYRSKTPMTPPGKACFDVEAPVIERARLRRRVVSARVRDTACGKRAAAPRVTVGGRRLRVRDGRVRAVVRRRGVVRLTAVDAAGNRAIRKWLPRQ